MSGNFLQTDHNQVNPSLYSRYYAEACNKWWGHLRLSAPGQHSSEESSQRWRAYDATVSNLTGPGIEPQSTATIAISLPPRQQTGCVLISSFFVGILDTYGVMLSIDEARALMMKYDIGEKSGMFAYQDFLRNFILNLKPSEENILQRKKIRVGKIPVNFSMLLRVVGLSLSFILDFWGRYLLK